jgi:hypothetical protein
LKFELARRNQDMAIKAAVAADRVATEDLKDFLSSQRQRQIDSFDRSVLNARNRLEYQSEELKQLELMYLADDLTEETEEIILKRTRDAVESAKYSLDVTLDAQRKGLQFELPRTEEQLEDAVTRAALALEEARRSAPQSIERQQLQIDKQRQDLDRKLARLDRLRADARQLIVTAPQSGIVYYGVPRDGKWAERSSVEAVLQPGGNPKPRTGLLTLAQPRPLVLRTMVPEASLARLPPGTELTIEPTAFADRKLKGRVSERSSVPVADGQFSATIALDEVELPAELVPGMKAQLILDAPSASQQ